jgi:hypothetical protein
MLALLHGEVVQSLAIHPFATPTLLSQVLVSAATIHSAWTLGNPVFFYRSKFGKSALAFVASAFVASLALWALRAFGYAGGPVAVE